MTAYEIFLKVIKDGGIGLVIILTLIQIAPIKINPWSSIAAAIGRAFNKSLIEDITELKKDVSSMKDDIKNLDDKIKENDAVDARVRIIRFGDEVSHNIKHSRDHYQQIMADITMYNQYCEDHPKFKNNMTKITSARIEEDYIIRDKNNDFL